jgi:putative transposase
VAWLCKHLGVARSSFYAWRQRQQNPDRRALENVALTTAVEAVSEQHRGF